MLKSLEQLSPAESRALALAESGVDRARLDRIAEQLHRETDRGAVLLGAAWLDDGLKELLRAFLFIAGRSRDDLLDGQDGLATFSLRIKLCHRLGLIGNDMRKAIDIVRKIRNDFAHAVEPASLSASPHREHIAELPDFIPSPTFWELYQTKFYGKERGPRVKLRSTLPILNALVESSIPGVQRARLQGLLGTTLPGTTKKK